MIPLNGVYKLVTAVVMLSVGVAAAGAEARSSDQVLNTKAMLEHWEPSPEERDWLAAIPIEVKATEAHRRAERLETERAAREQLAFQETVRHDQVRRDQRLREIADLVPLEYRTMVLDQADRYGLDPRILAAVALVESKWVVRARGAHGDSGLMQIVPGTAELIARHLGLREYNLYNPETNLAMGAWYLKTLYDEYGNWPQALAAYNGGPKLASLGMRHPYVQRVLAEYGKKGS